jgi:excisionase family DNA binding protein
MTDSKAPPKYLTVKQTAEYLQISERTVWNYIAAGKLDNRPFISGGPSRITVESIQQLENGGDNGYHRD